jgi:hypothetical protein
MVHSRFFPLIFYFRTLQFSSEMHQAVCKQWKSWDMFKRECFLFIFVRGERHIEIA